MRAAAPSALWGGWSRSWAMTGGQQGPNRPPLKTLTGFMPLLISWPIGEAQNFAFLAAFCSGVMHRKEKMFGGAAGPPGAPGGGAVGGGAPGLPGMGDGGGGPMG